MKGEVKARRKAKYQEFLFQASTVVLPSVVLKAGEDTTPGEMVDEAILIATNLLAELGYEHD